MHQIERRTFLGKAAAAAGLMFVPRNVLGAGGEKAPSDTLNIAAAGVGGQGKNDVYCVRDENIVALCDVDFNYAAKVFNDYPKAKRYRDFRKMLEKQKDIDAVVVATPDHLHAVVSMTAIRLGKHVYCEKPLAHSIYEIRKLTQAARKHKVATQMGIQGHATEGSRLMNEWIWDGAIGQVREVHAWTNKPVWPQGVDRPKQKPPVPKSLDWDLWLGPAPERPYHPAYHPFKWRGWWDFGSCSLGDMGCHVLDHPFWALKLGHPTNVEAYSTAVNSETGPLASMVYYEFPARGDMPPVKLTWYDGGMMPPRPEELGEKRRMGDNEGVLFVGDKGKLVCGCYGRSPRLIPESRMRAYERPPKTLPRSVGHHKEWIAACKGGKPAEADFDYAGPLAEVVQLGNVAIRAGKRYNRNGMEVGIDWDAENMKVTNVPEAEQYINPPYRKGWSL